MGSEEKDYYALLGLERGVDSKAIRKAYWDLARRCHPDMSEPDVKMFLLITTAYEVLSDPERRWQYDRWGAMAERLRGQEFDWKEVGTMVFEKRTGAKPKHRHVK